MLRPNFCRPDGRLVKLLLFSKLLDKSPRTFIYCKTFEKKRRVRSPLPHTIKLFGFWHNYLILFMEQISNKPQEKVDKKSLIIQYRGKCTEDYARAQHKILAPCSCTIKGLHYRPNIFYHR